MNITSPSLAVLSGVHVVASYFQFSTELPARRAMQSAAMLQAMLVLATLSAASGLGLAEWLSTHSVGIGSNVVLASGDTPLAARSVEAGETLLELQSGACLTARAAYADRELGRDLQDIAAQVGPGFDTVALATLCAAERVRGFEAETWYAGSSAAEQAPCTPHHAH